MIRDSQAQFDWDAAITASRVSTDKIDLKAPRADLGLFDDLYMVILVSETFTAAGAATLSVDLVDDDNAELASPNVIMPLANAIPKASLVAGYEIFKGRFPIGKIAQQFLGLSYTVATGPFTAGKIKAFLTPNIDQQFAYPRGYVNY